MEENIDKVTGFQSDSPITPIQKTRFLKELKTSGNQSAASDKIGFLWTEVEKELNKDNKFRDAYLECLLVMKHELEGILYRRAIEKKDVNSAVRWLSAKFPGEYGPNKPKPEKKQSKDKLFDGLLNE